MNNSSEKPANNTNRYNSEAVEKLAANLLKDEKNINFGSLFKMANKILKDDSLMGLVEEISQKPPEDKDRAAIEEAQDTENRELLSLQKEMEAIKSELKATRKEVAELKKQNASLLSLYLKVLNAANNDFKKGIGVITGISKLLK
jgi:small-conductance mechanosensitive channel